jgi:GR25 family glycosyltransferase involved in LPS biosynthesis
MINKVLGIQCFVKYDTTKILLKHLSQCYDKENYIVIFLIDNTINMPYKNREHWIENNNKVSELVSEYASKNIHKDTIVLKNESNLGTSRTCYKLINYCMELSDYIIFLEDDIILGKDALIFYHQAFLFNQKDETMFGVHTMGSRQMSKLEKDLFTLKKCNWIGSAEFGIGKKVWQKYGHLRGQRPHGAFDFGNACRHNNMHTIFPIVNRSCRIGIHHADSYSGYHNNNIDQNRNQNCSPVSDNFVISDLEYINYGSNLRIV